MSDESIFREVDEEVRNEQFQKLWDKYGVYLIAICVGIVAAVGGIKGWQAWEKSAAEAAGARYLEAMDLFEEEKVEEAQTVLRELADDGPGGYALLANFQTATALVEAGDTEGAKRILEAMAASYSATDLVGNLARLKLALLNIDTADFDTISAGIGPIAAQEGPYRNAAREILALSAYRAADYAAADRLYVEVRSDPTASQSTQDRARRMQELIEPYLPGGDDGAAAGGDAQ